MTKQRLLGPTLFAALIVAAAVAAGCAGGGTGAPAVPAAPGSPSLSDAARRHRANATLRLIIPRKLRRHGHGRHPEYISPNTGSLTVGVQQVTASPWPSMPTQTLVVATPQPCTASATTITCDFNVQAYVGNDVFTFNDYASKSPSPADTPLATLTSGVTKVGSGTALDFALEGVVNEVVLGVPNPESSVNPVLEATQPVPIGAGSSFQLVVNPQDASGASIATDTFSAPVTIAVASAAPGVTLALASPCAGDTATPSKITLNCAADLTHVTVSYDGTVTPSGTGFLDSTTISALPQPATSPVPVTVDLTSNVVGYPIAGQSSGADYYFSNLALDPVSGQFLFAATYTNPELYEFDPATHKKKNASPGVPVSSVAVDSNEQIWASDPSNDAVYCFSTLTSSAATESLTAQPQGIALDGSGNVWYVGGYQSQAIAGFFPDSCANGSSNPQITLSSTTSTAFGLTAYGSSGISTLVSTSPYQLFQVTTQSSPVPTATPALAWDPNVYPLQLTADGASTVYSATNVPGSNPIIQDVPAGASSLTTLTSLPLYTYIQGIAQYGTVSGAAQTLAISDDDFNSITLVNAPFTTTDPLMMPLFAINCGPVSFDKNGNAWVICARYDGSIYAYRPIVTSHWAAVQSTFYYYGYSTNEVLGFPETGAGSAPFTVTQNSNPSVLATGTPWPATPVLQHEIPVEVNATGSDVLTVTDANGRSQQVTVTVLQGPESDDRRHHRRHAYLRPRR